MAKKKPSDDQEPEATGEPQADDATSDVSTLEHEHYLQIREMNRDVQKIYWEWDAAKENAAALKKELDKLRSELTTLIARGPDPQLPLFGNDADESWKSRSINVLAISDSLANKLDEAGIGTLGDLKAFWDEGKLLCDLKGIGDEKSATIADAWAEYCKSHSEIFGAETAGEESTDGDGEETAA